VVLKGHVDFRRTPPPPRGTLVLLYPEAQVETDDDSWALLDWVEQGGRLVLPMPSGDAAPSLSAMLGDGLGVEALRGAAAEIDCPRLRLAEGVSEVVCGTPFAVTGLIDDALVWPKAGHARIARLPYGEGEVLVLSELDAFTNRRLSPLGTTADAEADAERQQRRDAQTRLMAQLAGAWVDGEAVWILSHRGGSLAALLDDCADAAVDVLAPEPVWTREHFAVARDRVRDGIAATTADILGRVETVLAALHAAQVALPDDPPPAQAEAVADIRAQLSALLPAGFVTETGAAHLGDLARYLSAISRRLERLPHSPQRDLASMSTVHRLQERWAAAVDAVPAARPVPAELSEVRWMLEEVRC
jgi:hypothetical protein